MAESSAHDVDLYVGNRLRQRRKHLGMTQIALADALGLTFQQVQKYERGANRVSASMLHMAAKALGVQVAYFFEGYADSDNGGELSAERSIHDFLRTAEGMELARHFPRISNPKLRRRVLELVRTLSAEDEDRDEEA